MPPPSLGTLGPLFILELVPYHIHPLSSEGLGAFDIDRPYRAKLPAPGTGTRNRFASTNRSYGGDYTESDPPKFIVKHHDSNIVPDQ